MRTKGYAVPTSRGRFILDAEGRLRALLQRRPRSESQFDASGYEILVRIRPPAGDVIRIWPDCPPQVVEMSMLQDTFEYSLEGAAKATKFLQEFGFRVAVTVS